MKTFNGVIVPDSFLSATHKDLVEKLNSCKEPVTLKNGDVITPSEYPNEMMSLQDLRERCGEVFYGASSSSSMRKASLSPAKTSNSKKRISREDTGCDSPLKMKRAKTVKEEAQKDSANTAPSLSSLIRNGVIKEGTQNSMIIENVAGGDQGPPCDWLLKINAEKLNCVRF